MGCAAPFGRMGRGEMPFERCPVAPDSIRMDEAGVTAARRMVPAIGSRRLQGNQADIRGISCNVPERFLTCPQVLLYSPLPTAHAIW